MKCFFCKGHLEDKETTFMAEIGKSIMIIKNVPSQVCSQCEEVSYNNDIANSLDQIINNMRVQLTEIAVVNYPDRVS